MRKGTDPGVYTWPFWNRSETDLKLDLENSRSSFAAIWSFSFSFILVFLLSHSIYRKKQRKMVYSDKVKNKYR